MKKAIIVRDFHWIGHPIYLFKLLLALLPNPHRNMQVYVSSESGLNDMMVMDKRGDVQQKKRGGRVMEVKIEIS